MKLPSFVLFLACATTAAATVSCSSESTPPDIPPILPRYAFKPPVQDYYPSASRDLKEQGTTKIRLCYDELGMPNPVTVDESSGFERLDEAAVRWGKAVRVTPGLYGKRPQPACVKIPVKFSPEKSHESSDWREELLLPPVEPAPILVNPPPPRPPPEPIPLAPSPPAKPMPLSGDSGQHLGP